MKGPGGRDWTTLRTMLRGVSCPTSVLFRSFSDAASKDEEDLENKLRAIPLRRKLMVAPLR